jgi:hypothetical protein
MEGLIPKWQGSGICHDKMDTCRLSTGLSNHCERPIAPDSKFRRMGKF